MSDVVSLSSLVFGRGSKSERVCLMCFIYSLLFAPPIKERDFL